LAEPRIKQRLESKEFTTDVPASVRQRLTACLESDPDHILPQSMGGRPGPHVEVIQKALEKIRTTSPGLGLPSITDPPGIYGSSTAAAVLKYKQVNGIQRSGQPMDNIVGRMTITRLDDELKNLSSPRPEPPVPPAVPRLSKVKFWIKAFIPRDVPTLTKQLLGGPDKGQTVLEFFGLFHTDQRTFSSELAASARLHIEFDLDLDSLDVTSRKAFCSESKKYEDIITGRIVERKTAAPTFIVDGRQFHTDGRVRFSGAAANPLAPPGAPDIDIAGTVTVNSVKASLELNCVVDDFPFYEAYTTSNGGSPFKLFEAPPQAGKTPQDLAGAAMRRIHVITSDTNADGQFDTRTILPDSIQPVR
jgi:peptidoglycan hydrolase-like protein with peptidoglycan-binding domain